MGNKIFCSPRIINIMKKFFIFIIFILFPFAQLSASEIFGNISTNPQLINNEAPDSSNQQESAEDNQEEPEENNELPKINYSGNSFILPANQESKEKKEDNNKDKEVITLGISVYADGALLRGEDNKIYLISKGFKIYIFSMEKLKEYSGQVIYDVGGDELIKYKDKKYFVNDLIREQGDVKVFIITDNGLKHILNLQELRLNYFGQEIFNVNNLEFSLY